MPAAKGGSYVKVFVRLRPTDTVRGAGQSGGGELAYTLEGGKSITVRAMAPAKEKEGEEEGGGGGNVASPAAAEKGPLAGARDADLTYAFHRIFDVDTDQDMVYREVASNMVQHAFRGYNSSCFAYGQTGSGKTFTMLGTRTDPGVLPCAIKAVFDAVAAKEAGAAATVTCRMSYLEIYNEEVNDLLQAGEEGGAAPFAPSSAAPARGRGRNLKLLGEDPLRGALVEGLREVPVYTWAEVRRARRPPRPPTRCARAPRGAH